MYYGRRNAVTAVAGLGILGLFGIVFEALWTLVFLIVVGLIGFTLICTALAGRGMRKILHRKYGNKPQDEIPLSTQFRLRAAELRMLDADDVPQAPLPELPPPPEPVPGEREDMVADLFSSPDPCPECSAETGVPCRVSVWRDGRMEMLPFAIVRKVPLAVCHLPRMQDAVEHGTASADEVMAQFGNHPPLGLKLR